MLTVMMASYNGAGWIAQCLDSFCALEQPEGGYKLVIIDNASTDGTADIVRSYLDRLPITLLFQPKPGKNRALNLGLEHIEGDLIVFTDDDVIVTPDWLAQWRRVADQFPQSDIFGGCIKPHWRKQPPEWLLEIINIPMVYALTGERHQEDPNIPVRIFGPNMMIRASFFAGGQRFDETIGPDGTMTYVMGSEIKFTRSIPAPGMRLRSVPQPAVYHIIRAEQVDPDWVAGRYTRYGYNLGRDAAENYQGPKLFGAPRYLLRILFESGLMKLIYSTIGNTKLFYKHTFLYNQSLGALREFKKRKNQF